MSARGLGSLAEAGGGGGGSGAGQGSVQRAFCRAEAEGVWGFIRSSADQRHRLRCRLAGMRSGAVAGGGGGRGVPSFPHAQTPVTVTLKVKITKPDCRQPSPEG